MEDFSITFDEEPLNQNYFTDISYHDALASLQQLQQSMHALVKIADARMSRIESSMSNLVDSVSRSRIIPITEDEAQSECAPDSPLPLSQTDCDDMCSLTPCSSFALKIVGLDTRWYTKRPMAPFQIQIVDENDKLAQDLEGYDVIVHLVSGHGVLVDQYLANTELTFPVVEGRADISSLRFLAVSSRNGGHFRLRFEASGPCPVASAESDDIEILSERLKNEHKAESILDLGPDDQLVRVPGIGKKYAQKLSQQGLHTVRDLAKIDTSPEARSRRLEILSAVRRDRGALTEAKLVEMLRDAKAVVKREREGDVKQGSDADFPPSKKQRVLDITTVEKKIAPITAMDSCSFVFDPNAFMNTLPCTEDELDHAFLLD